MLIYGCVHDAQCIDWNQLSLTGNDRQSQSPVALKQKDDEWRSLVEQRNKLARERAAVQNGIRIKNAGIDDIHAKLLSLG